MRIWLPYLLRVSTLSWNVCSSRYAISIYHSVAKLNFCLSCTMMFKVFVDNFRTRLFTVRNEVAKVMFLHLSVILFTGGVPGQVPPQTRYTPQDQVHPLGPGTPPRTMYTPGTRYTPWDQVHPLPGPGTHPRTRYTPPADGYCCGR